MLRSSLPLRKSIFNFLLLLSAQAFQPSNPPSHLSHFGSL